MKSQGQHQHRFLSKYTNLCELANGLVLKFDELNSRDLGSSIRALVDADVAFPLVMKLKVTTRHVSDSLSDMLADAGDQDHQDQCRTSIIKAVCGWEHEVGDLGISESWSALSPAFSPLVAEIDDLNTPLLLDDDDKESMKQAKANNQD